MHYLKIKMVYIQNNSQPIVEDSRLNQMDQLTQMNQMQLQQQIGEQATEIEELKARVTQADNDYNSLKMARMLEITDGNLEEAKERLAKMIRQVNKCIAILSDEQ